MKKIIGVLLVSFFIVGSLSFAVPVSLDQASKGVMAKAFKEYENLYDSYYNFNESKIKENAKSLVKLLESVKDPELSKMLQFSEKKLSEIDMADTKEKKDEILHVVSSSFSLVMKKYNIGDNYETYTCPMVKKKWLQNKDTNKDTKNPYAETMRECGNKN